MKTPFPKFRSYGNYASNNYGAHCLVFTAGPLTAWFSYETMVAFQFEGHKRVVIKNYWGPTTGKHLNWIDNGDKSSRVDQDTFNRLYAAQSDEAYFPQPKPDANSPFAVGALVG